MDPELMKRLALIKHGIPFHIAMDLAPEEDFVLDRSWAITFSIGFGLLAGHRFDWTIGDWAA